MKVAIIGVGLIGGSFSLGLQQHFNQLEVSGIDQNPAHLKTAKQLGLIHQTISLEEITGLDVVVLCVPVNAAVKLLPQVLDLVSPETLVIDMGSTKLALCEAVEHHPKRQQYLATHPIAGTEFSGPTAAIANLFEAKTNIICNANQTEDRFLKRALTIFKPLQMRLRYMDAKSHDKHIAYVSHLSHISSFMLGKTVIEKEKSERHIFDMAGSGFASTVRLAKSSPDMWAPIFEQNKSNVIESLTEYIKNLEQFKQQLEKGDFIEIYKSMKQTNHIKSILKGIKS